MGVMKANAGASCKPKQKGTKAGAKLNMGGYMKIEKQKPMGANKGGYAKKAK